MDSVAPVSHVCGESDQAYHRLLYSCGHCYKPVPSGYEQSKIDVCPNCASPIHDSCTNNCSLRDGPGMIGRLVCTVLLLPLHCRRCDVSLPRFKTPSWPLCRPCWLNFRGVAPWHNAFHGVAPHGGRHDAYVENGRLQTGSSWSLHFGNRCAHCGANVLPSRDVEICDWRPQGAKQCFRCFVGRSGDTNVDRCLSWYGTGSCLECGGFIHSSCADHCNAPPANPNGHDWIPLGVSTFRDGRYSETYSNWKCRRCYRSHGGDAKYSNLPPCKPKDHKWGKDDRCVKCSYYKNALRWERCEPNVHEWVTTDGSPHTKKCRRCHQPYENYIIREHKRCRG